MSLFEEQSLITTRLTYRAVGSSTGGLEFLGLDNSITDPITGNVVVESHVPHNDFGAGDIPIKKDSYHALNKAVQEQNGKVYSEENTGSDNLHMVHLPFAMSSVSFFHSIPGIPDGSEGIKLDACDLARIFNGKVQQWSDAEIVDKQSKDVQDVLKNLDGAIYVSRRVEGSSSTKSITQFLNAKCPNEWSEDLVDSKLDDWHVSTHACQGSAGMTACLKNNPGAIGYLDSGHGWSKELAEVNVKNQDGTYLTSRYAHENGGISDAASNGEVPDRADLDWSDVNFLNKAGKNTWPIVVMSYVYVRKDVNRFMQNVDERGLMKLFLEALYDEEYFGNCKKLGFSAPPKDVVDIAKEGIESVNWAFLDNENMWSFEYAHTTRKIDGMGKYVISGKRKSLAGVNIDDIAGAEAKLKGDVAYLVDVEAKLKSDIEYLTNAFDNMMQGVDGEFSFSFKEAAEDRDRTEAALVLAALSFTMWSCVIVGFVIKKFVFGK